MTSLLRTFLLLCVLVPSHASHRQGRPSTSTTSESHRLQALVLRLFSLLPQPFAHWFLDLLLHSHLSLGSWPQLTRSAHKLPQPTQPTAEQALGILGGTTPALSTPSTGMQLGVG